MIGEISALEADFLALLLRGVLALAGVFSFLAGVFFSFAGV
jgi:hypothetical protein